MAAAVRVAARRMSLNTMLAGGTGMLGWPLVEQRRDAKPTTLGAARPSTPRPPRTTAAPDGT
jgi:ammonium transporter, Amt family